MIWSRSHRLLARGEAHLVRWEFRRALECFDAAHQASPAEAGPLLRRGQALAELGRYDDAVRAVERAARLEPRNHALPLMVAFVHLDAGRLADADEALARTERLDPGNDLVEALKQLVAYRRGSAPAILGLGERSSRLPLAFGARLLSSLPFSDARPYLDPPAPDQGASFLERRGPAFVKRLCAAWRERGALRLAGRADRLVRQGRNAEVVELLGSPEAVHSLDDRLAGILREARKRAIATLADSQAGSRHVRRKQRTPAQLREDTLQRARLRDPADSAALRSDLMNWMDSFRRDREPKSERPVAAMVETELARLAVLSGEPREAVKHCERARACEENPEADWTQAVASGVLGDRISSRRYFERFGVRDELEFHDRARALVSRIEPPGAETA
jgi:hypothetical protein